MLGLQMEVLIGAADCTGMGECMRIVTRGAGGACMGAFAYGLGAH